MATRYVVTVRGRELAVEVTELAGGRFAAKVEGAPEPVEVILRGDTTGAIASVGHETLELGGSGNEVSVRGERKPVRVENRQASQRTRAAAKSRASGIVSAPMPGRVVKLLVEPGNTVERGASVIVVEAMKMENELGSPVTGVVEKVFVKAGDAVERGAPLVEIR